jgi:hypothetical protein
LRLSSVSLKAYSVLELPAHTIYRTGTREGDCLEIAWSQASGTAGARALRESEDSRGPGVVQAPLPGRDSLGEKPAIEDPATLRKAG